MQKSFNYFIGIDISKRWFDAAFLHTKQIDLITHKQFNQDQQGYNEFMEWIEKQGVAETGDCLICMEHTGLYNTGILNFLAQATIPVWVEMATKIKKASGLERGTDDKSAATKIALYAFRFQDKAALWKPVNTRLLQIKNLLSQRDRLVTASVQLKVPLEELNQCGSKDEAKLLAKLQQKVIKELEKSIQEVEASILQLVEADKELKRKADILKSIKGIGLVTAVHLLVYTNGFTSFDSSKQLACYCGVVPFTKSSGSSVRHKASVSPFANRKLKTLLHMCALSAIRYDPELKKYYDKKVVEGKNKMCVINAVRNKLTHRIFALVRDNRMYEENYTRKCA